MNTFVELGRQRQENERLVTLIREIEETCESFLPRAALSDAVVYGGILLIQKIIREALDSNVKAV